MTKYDETVQEIAERSAYRLANDADVHSPDSLESPGAVWLERVRNAVLEQVDYTGLDDTDDRLAEIADYAVDVYTYQRWQAFTDLCLWQEDEIGELAGDTGTVDMTELAGLAQYLAAHRLAGALVQELRDAQEEDDEDDECEGHESLDGAHMGETVVCDGTCKS